MAPKINPDMGAGLRVPGKNLDPHPSGPAQPPESQQNRAMQMTSTFLSGIMAISASQWIGAPFKYMDAEFYKSYMAYTKESFAVLMTTMTQWWAPTVVRISCDASMRGQLHQQKDGTLRCNFPSRLVLMANHQLYTDWLYLWWIAYTNDMHGRIYIILKESLKKIPIFGWGAQFYNFIFLSRNWEQDKPRFQKHLESLKKVTEPMWLLIFPEGTNLASSTREVSRQWAEKNGIEDMKHQLLPRSTGLRFCLQELKGSTGWLYDCTIAYEGVPSGQFGQDIFTLRTSFFEGRPPKSVNMHWRRFKIADIPLENAKEFEVWLRNRWREKDYLLEHYYRTKRFPTDEQWILKEGSVNSGKSKSQRLAPYIETQVKSRNWEEFLSIFEPITAVLVGLSMLNGGAGNTSSSSPEGRQAQQEQQMALMKNLMASKPPTKPNAQGNPQFKLPENLFKEQMGNIQSGAPQKPPARPASTTPSGTRGPAYSANASSAQKLHPQSSVSSQQLLSPRRPPKLARDQPSSVGGSSMKTTQADDLPVGASAASLNSLRTRRSSFTSVAAPSPPVPTKPATSAAAAASAQQKQPPKLAVNGKTGTAPGTQKANGAAQKTITSAQPASRQKSGEVPLIKLAPGVKLPQTKSNTQNGDSSKTAASNAPLLNVSPEVLARLKANTAAKNGTAGTPKTPVAKPAAAAGAKKPPKLATAAKQEPPPIAVDKDTLARLRATSGLTK